MSNLSRKPEVQQNIFRTDHPPISLSTCREAHLTADILVAFLATADGVVGLAPRYNHLNRTIESLVLSTESQALLVIFPKPTGPPKKTKTKAPANLDDFPGRKALSEVILCELNVQKCAFRMDRLAAALYLDLGLLMSCAIDLLSMNKTVWRYSQAALLIAMGGKAGVFSEKVKGMFAGEESVQNTSPDCSAMQAWAARHSLSFQSSSQLYALPRINTSVFQSKLEELLVICVTIRHGDMLYTSQPDRVKNDVSQDYKYTKEGLKVNSVRYGSRIMRTPNQTIEVECVGGDGNKTTLPARAKRVTGREANLEMDNLVAGINSLAVTTIGRNDPTHAESQRTNIMLETLQTRSDILQNPFVQWIWFGNRKGVFPSRTLLPVPLASAVHLNESQEDAANRILSNKTTDRVVLCHGPPGTGKTTLIAAVVHSIASTNPSRPVWLIAQSNVAVKNIAEKLAFTGFTDFKLLVSEGFHFDWHEHLYEKIIRNIIVSADFSEDHVAMDRLLNGSTVMLSTLSMLSTFKIAAITRLVPISTVIVDEASQIEIGQYFPMLSLYQSTLQKLVFIGDDKQLPPFGQESARGLRSVFEVQHLRKKALFLDTQYRMPTPIGEFVSEHVYEGRLKSHHDITNPKSCRFMHVHDGQEERNGNSWVNHAEVKAVIAVCVKYTRQQKAYKVITPYDPQRQLIENGLKAAKIAWEDRCFNVDSFQGNECDHIIISVVRSDQVGFIRESRRVNVMITRCKKSMLLCTSRKFMTEVASDTLVGQLALAFASTEEAWLDSRIIEDDGHEEPNAEKTQKSQKENDDEGEDEETQKSAENGEDEEEISGRGQEGEEEDEDSASQEGQDEQH